MSRIEECRSCQDPGLMNVLSLGDVALSDFVEPGVPPVKKYPLEMVMCQKCSLLQLRHTTPQSELYTDRYGYRSGINATMRTELAGIVDEVSERVPLVEGDIVLDIGANDGTLLGNYPPGILRAGFEPIREMSRYSTKFAGGEDNIDVLFLDFFRSEPFLRRFGGQKAKIITAISMFYDLDDPNKFLGDVKECLDSEGLLVIQQNYAGGMLEQKAFDNIVHEHLEYYTLSSILPLVGRQGLKVVDVETNEINGGSFRTYITHEENKQTDPQGATNVQAMLEDESQRKLTSPDTYKDFGRAVNCIRRDLYKFVSEEVREGKTFYIYGASTRGNTLLQSAMLDSQLITGAAERNESKWGKVMASTGIPIVSEAEARAANPDYFLVLPWFFKDEFVQREREYLDKGGHLVFPLPQLEVI